MDRSVAGRFADHEQGAALVLALVAIVLLLTLGGALVMLTTTETAIAASFRDGVAAFYAADGAVERTLVDLGAAADWDDLVSGLPRAPEAPWRVFSSSVMEGRLSVDIWIKSGSAAGLLNVQARATGGHGVRRTIEATVARAGGGVRVLAWHEVGVGP